MNYNWQIISPEIAILATAFVMILIDLFTKKIKYAALLIAGVAGILLAILLTFQNYTVIDIGFAGGVLSDPIGFYFKIIFCLGTLLTLFTSATYVKREINSPGEYYVLIFIATFGMMVMATAADLITIFLGLEVMSIPLYVLAGINRNRPRSREASMKYFLLGAFASGFLLYGIALLFGAFGTTNLREIAGRFSLGMNYNQILAGAGAVLILIGLGFKAAIVPFHAWVPDVYEGSVAPITGFMSAGPKAAGFADMFRIFAPFSAIVSANFNTILWILAAATMTWGNILALSQKNIKRMLAYSSIAHAGYVMVALTAGGKAGLSAGIFYLLAYTFMNIGAFAIIILFAGKEEKLENIKDYAGFGMKYPFAGAALAIFLFSLAGIPSTAGFMGKYKIFMAAINSGYIWLAIIGVMNSLISVWYYLNVVVTMYMMPETENKTMAAISPSLLVAIIVSLAGTIQLGVIPNLWIKLSDIAGVHFQWLK